MANPQHLAILKQGKDAWNEWRKQHQDIHPDLSEANLRGADLKGAHLENANLTESLLERAHLREVHLEGANLDTTHLEGARLYRAGFFISQAKGGFRRGRVEKHCRRRSVFCDREKYDYLLHL